jgi:two-component system OmpR family response regulator
MNVLLIEDDNNLNETISSYLETVGYCVTSVLNGFEAAEIVASRFFDIYIIDINIPGIDGLELLRRIRDKQTDKPVIMITASIELESIQSSFGLGCNDYIKKPFYLEELTIRMERLLTKSGGSDTVIRLSEGINYDIEYEELTVNGEIKRLRKKERRLINILLRNVHKTIPTNVIEDFVWENEIKDSYPLRQLVSELKKQLGEEHKFIHADRGIGYRFEIER